MTGRASPKSGPVRLGRLGLLAACAAWLSAASHPAHSAGGPGLSCAWPADNPRRPKDAPPDPRPRLVYQAIYPPGMAPIFRSVSTAESARLSELQQIYNSADQATPEGKRRLAAVAREGLTLLEGAYGPAHARMTRLLYLAIEFDPTLPAEKRSALEARLKLARAHTAALQAEFDVICAQALGRWDDVVLKSDVRWEAELKWRGRSDSAFVNIMLPKYMAYRALGKDDEAERLHRRIEYVRLGAELRGLANRGEPLDGKITEMAAAFPPSPPSPGRRSRPISCNHGAQPARGATIPRRFRRDLACVRNRYGPDHLMTALAASHIASVFGEEGEWAEAARLGAIAHNRVAEIVGGENYLENLDAARTSAAITRAAEKKALAPGEEGLLQRYLQASRSQDLGGTLESTNALLVLYRSLGRAEYEPYLTYNLKLMVETRRLFADDPEWRRYLRYLIAHGLRKEAAEISWRGINSHRASEDPEARKSRGASAAIDFITEIFWTRRDEAENYLSAAISTRVKTPDIADFDRALVAVQEIDHLQASTGFLEAANKRAASHPQVLPALRRYKQARLRLQTLPVGPVRTKAVDESREAEEDILKILPDYSFISDQRRLGVSEVARSLGKNEALLVIVPAVDDLIVLAMSRRGRLAVRLADARPRIDAAVETLRCQLDPTGCAPTGAAENDIRRFDRRLSFSLYREIVRPVADALAGARHIRVMARGSLASLPLSVMVTSPPSKSESMSDPAAMASAPWLSNRYDLSTLPAMSSLLAAAPPRSGPSDEQTFVGFGAPRLLRAAHGETPAALPRADPDPGGLATARLFAKFSELPGAATELRDVADLFSDSGSLVYLGENATEAAVRSSPELAAAGMVSFATHGILSDETGDFGEPGLILTPPEKPTRENDGVLTAAEVALLDISADVVILSACNTASPANSGKRGESLSTLADAFLYAGARSLLASHWRVDDSVTSALITEFVRLRRARPGLTRSAALTLAMKATRTRNPAWSHPSLWAPFILIENETR